MYVIFQQISWETISKKIFSHAVDFSFENFENCFTEIIISMWLLPTSKNFICLEIFEMNGDDIQRVTVLVN